LIGFFLENLNLKLSDFLKTKISTKYIGLNYNLGFHLLENEFPLSIEEKDSALLNELQREYNQEIINVTDKCPACNSGILTNETECNNCGLNLVAR